MTSKNHKSRFEILMSTDEDNYQVLCGLANNHDVYGIVKEAKFRGYKITDLEAAQLVEKFQTKSDMNDVLSKLLSNEDWI